MNNKYQEALDRLNTINMVNFMGDKELIKHKDNDIKTLQELVDKETPKKVIEEEYSKRKDYKWKCPNCYNYIYKHEAKIWTYEYCPKCGQKLDWSEE